MFYMRPSKIKNSKNFAPPDYAVGFAEKIYVAQVVKEACTGELECHNLWLGINKS